MKRLTLPLLVVLPMFAAVQAPTQWYVRRPTTGGGGISGAAFVNACGGYDGVTYPGGANYADQDAPQVAFSAGNSNELSAAQNSTTLTSAGTPFTSQMVGNCILITTTGTGGFFTKGYYFITAVTDASNVVLDRAPATTGAGAAGDGYLGGAPSTILPYCGGTPTLGTCGSNGVGSPLVAGNTVNIQGGGSSDPICTSGTFNYDWSAGYVDVTNGSPTAGSVTVQGYNGRPCIKESGLMFRDTSSGYTKYSNLKFLETAGSANGVFDGDTISVSNVILDCNAQTNCSLYGPSGCCQDVTLRANEVRNTGGGAQNTVAAIDVSGIKNAIVANNYIHGVRGYAVKVSASSTNFPQEVTGNIFASTGNHAIILTGTNGNVTTRIVANTIYQPTGDCLNLSSAAQLTVIQFYNNICYQPTAYGINANVGSATANEFLKLHLIDFNDIFGAGTAAYNNLNAGANDLALDPGFVAAGTGDFRIGPNLKAKGYPGAFLGAAGSTGYTDMGAIQRQESGGGGGYVWIK